MKKIEPAKKRLTESLRKAQENCEEFRNILYEHDGYADLTPQQRVDYFDYDCALEDIEKLLGVSINMYENFILFNPAKK